MLLSHQLMPRGNLMTVSNEPNERPVPRDQANPSRESANRAGPKFPMPKEPFWAVIWAIAFVLMVVVELAIGVTNPVEWLLALVLLTPLYFCLVLIMMVPCLWLYDFLVDLCRWLVKFFCWIVKFFRWLIGSASRRR